jgi:uncharacterized membrane protein YqhA
MSRFLLHTRYLILIPIAGLAIAAAFFFVFGGIGLIRLLWELVGPGLGLAPEAVEMGQGVIIFEVVEYVHTFLVGTVLYITAVGLFQLFIQEISFPAWLKIDSTEELETNLIGVTVVVLAVNFMGAIFAGMTENLVEYGAGIALPIAALGLFIGLRAWSARIAKEGDRGEGGWKLAVARESVSPEALDHEGEQRTGREIT